MLPELLLALCMRMGFMLSCSFSPPCTCSGSRPCSPPSRASPGGICSWRGHRCCQNRTWWPKRRCETVLHPCGGESQPQAELLEPEHRQQPEKSCHSGDHIQTSTTGVGHSAQEPWPARSELDGGCRVVRALGARRESPGELGVFALEKKTLTGQFITTFTHKMSV